MMDEGSVTAVPFDATSGVRGASRCGSTPGPGVAPQVGPSKLCIHGVGEALCLSFLCDVV